MGCACRRLVFPDDVEEFRVMSHKKLDEWIDVLEEEFRKNPTPSLMQVSDLFHHTRHMLLGACMGAAIERLFPEYANQQWADCPKCGRKLHRKRMDKRRVSTMQGDFDYERPYFYCTDCRHGFHPLDEVIQVAPQHHQYDIQKKITDSSARVPYAEAAHFFENLTGLGLGNHFSHKSLNAVGQEALAQDVIPDTEEIEQRITEAACNSNDLPVLVLSADGATAPVRPRAPRKAQRGKGSYREVKGFRAYLVDARDRIQHIASWHQIDDVEGISQALEILAERIPQDAVEIALIGDGANWIWNTLLQHFPNAKQILDFYHCFEHLHTVAKAQYGEGTQRALEWAEASMARLCLGHFKRIIANLGRMRPRDANAQEQIRKLMVYLENQGPRIHYEDDLKNGYPIGSGGIESANKFICHTRLKRSGAWWVESMGNAMLRVRCAIYNNTFDRVFQKYADSQRPRTIRPK